MRLNNPTGIGVALVLAMAAPVSANRPFPARYDNAVNTLSAAGGVCAVFGVGLLFTAFAGGYQVGHYAARTILDPPDTINACNPVSFGQFLVGNEFPPAQSIDPTVDPLLGMMLDHSMALVNQEIALNRAIRAAMDRHAGALVLGNQPCADQRYAEAQSMLAQLKSTANQWASTVPPIMERFSQLGLGCIDQPIPLTAALNWRNAAASGQLPVLEPQPFAAWHITAEEHADIMARAVALTNADVDPTFQGRSNGTIRQSMIVAALDIAEVMQTTQISPPGSCSGDFNGDFRVDTADLAILLGGFGHPVAPGTSGDITGDGFVNTADLAAMLGRFGSIC